MGSHSGEQVGGGESICMVMVVVGSLATCRGVSWVSREELLSVLYRQKPFEVRYLDEQKFNEIIDKLYNARNEIMELV